MKAVLYIMLLQVYIFSEESFIDTIMTPKTQEEIGLTHASEEQKKAFEQWASSWTQTVIQQAPSYAPSQSLSQWIHSWPNYVQNKSVLTEKDLTEKSQDNQVIFRNNNGKSIELKNGSLWNILSFDSSTVVSWQRGQQVSIQPSQDPIRPYLITNIERQEKVGATQQRPADPSGARLDDDPAFFANTQKITTIGNRGKTITLEDGSSWTICLKKQSLILQNWKVKDRIRVEPTQTGPYTHTLTNVDSAETVLATTKP